MPHRPAGAVSKANWLKSTVHRKTTALAAAVGGPIDQHTWPLVQNVLTVLLILFLVTMQFQLGSARSNITVRKIETARRERGFQGSRS